MSLPGRAGAPQPRTHRMTNGRLCPALFQIMASVWRLRPYGKRRREPDSGRSLKFFAGGAEISGILMPSRRAAAPVHVGEQQEAHHEAAEMRVPGDRRVLRAERQGDESEQEVRPEPDAEEDHRR